jgi:hypothetical protein
MARVILAILLFVSTMPLAEAAPPTPPPGASSVVSGLPGDLRQRLTKVRLRMARIMPQRYEDLELPQSARQHVVLNNGDPAGIAVLVAKPLEDPLRGGARRGT